MSGIEVSIIIPTYNSEKYIDRVLKKLFSAKTEIPFEVLVIDGCSSDKTVDICSEYNVRIYNNQKVHAAAARNIGITNSVGKICAFIDSDCIPCDDWIDIIYNEFNKDVNLVAIGGKMVALTPVNRIERFCGNIFLHEIMRFDNQRTRVNSIGLTSAFITANAAYTRTSLQSLNGFIEQFANYGEDIDLYWRCLRLYKGSMLYVPELVVQHSFPSTIIGLVKKYHQYGIASSMLTKAHSPKRVHIDYRLYVKLIIKCITIILNPIENALYILQITSHLCGKIYGSYKCSTINL